MTAILTDEQVREKFEAWYIDEMRTVKPAHEPEIIRRDDLQWTGRRYSYTVVNLIWKCWQAAARLGAEIERERVIALIPEHVSPAMARDLEDAIRARARKETEEDSE